MYWTGSETRYSIRLQFELDARQSLKVTTKPESQPAAGPLPTDPGWVQLFNRRDLTEWTTTPTGPGSVSGWRVGNGGLIGTGPATTEVRTKRADFANFRFRAEVKLNKSAYARVLMRHEDFPGGMRGYTAEIGVGKGGESPSFDRYGGPDGTRVLQH